MSFPIGFARAVTGCATFYIIKKAYEPVFKKIDDKITNSSQQHAAWISSIALPAISFSAVRRSGVALTGHQFFSKLEGKLEKGLAGGYLVGSLIFNERNPYTGEVVFGVNVDSRKFKWSKQDLAPAQQDLTAE